MRSLGLAALCGLAGLALVAGCGGGSGVSQPPPDSTTVISPNGVEEWGYGETRQIVWLNIGTPTTVDIAYRVSDASPWVDIVVGEPSTGSYDWAVPPGVNSTTCSVRIRAYSTDPGVYVEDISNAHFTIWKGAWKVVQGGSGVTGKTWADAFGTLQQAIDAAETDGGGEVWVAGGLYQPSATITMKADVQIYGGFQVGDILRTDRDWSANPSTLDGQTARQVVSAVSAANARLDGFTIMDGSSVQGGGMSISGMVSITVANCVFETNTASQDGGAIHVLNCDATCSISGCTFTSNSADLDGGGISNDTASPTVTGCTFDGNAALGGSPDGRGGAINNSGSSPDITGCTFVNNLAREGGAVAGTASSAPVISVCTFQDNTATRGGGLFLLASQASVSTSDFTTNDATGSSDRGGAVHADTCTPLAFTSCTFISNDAGGSGGAVSLDSCGTIAVTSCTFLQNSAGFGGGAIRSSASADLAVSKSFFLGNAVPAWGAAAYGTDDVSEYVNCVFSGNRAGPDPLQVAAGGGIYLGGSATADIKHCTFSLNVAEDGPVVTGAAGGLACVSTVVANVVNSIFWGNQATDWPQIREVPGATTTVSYCDIENPGANTYTDGGGNIPSDPMFLDADGVDNTVGTLDDNVRPGVSALCINAGTAAGVADDIVGMLRDGSPDMGAYEW